MVDLKLDKNLRQFGWCILLLLLIIVYDVYLNWNDVLVLSSTVPYRYFQIRQKQVKQYHDQSLHVVCPSLLSYTRLQSITRLPLSSSSSSCLSMPISSPSSLQDSLSLQHQQQPQQEQQRQQEELSSIDECINWIDQYCHRTFLHAVIASDYHFLYRGCSSSSINTINVNKIPVPMIQYNEVYDLLNIDTYGINGLQYFQKLEMILQNETIRPSIGHLATTSYIDANQWGDYVASIWPATIIPPPSTTCTSNSNDLCTTTTTTAITNGGSNGYAWFKDGGLFYPRPIMMDESDDSTIRQSLVVIGDDHNDDDDDVSNSNINGTNINIKYHRDDCGEYYLEDALQYTNCEILFTSNTFLTIPIIYEKELRNHLRKNAFLI